MNQRLKNVISEEWMALFELKKTERLWHIPVLASLCVGLPLLVGWWLVRLDLALLSCLGGLVILYMPSTGVANRMITLLACSFGFMVSYAVGIVFSFHPLVSSFALALFSFGVHWAVRYLQLRPPGNFFFIMLASISSCAPFNLEAIPTKIGLIGLSTMLACTLALFYSLYIVPKQVVKESPIKPAKNHADRMAESAVMGIFIGGSLYIAHLLHLENPYWVPISCLAVMQGVSTKHIWQRSFQRVLGTSLGMVLAWLLLLLKPGPLGFVLGILVLQFVVEMLIVRHYALAVVFITPMTLFLAEAGAKIIISPTELIGIRFLNIVVGSAIGALGGWFLYHQQLKRTAQRQLRKTKVAIGRR